MSGSAVKGSKSAPKAQTKSHGAAQAVGGISRRQLLPPMCSGSVRERTAARRNEAVRFRGEGGDWGKRRVPRGKHAGYFLRSGRSFPKIGHPSPGGWSAARFRAVEVGEKGEEAGAGRRWVLTASKRRAKTPLDVASGQGLHIDFTLTSRSLCGT